MCYMQKEHRTELASCLTQIKRRLFNGNMERKDSAAANKL